MTASTLPQLGFGLGLRPQHYPHIFAQRPSVGWFEIISENFMDTEGKPKRNLERILEHYPVVMHGVALSIGTVDPLDSEYLRKLKALIRFANPAWVSDHLCWTGVAHRNTHDLLPVPYTEQALRQVVTRIRQVQDFLERPIALENPSTYLEFTASHMPEAEFIARMVQESGCNLLLDVNNVYVTCFNHRLDAHRYLDMLPLDRVIQIHLAGHCHKGTHIIDTHDDHVADAVWQLYQYVLQRAGRVPNTMVEWDDNIPEFAVLQAELTKAKTLARQAHESASSCSQAAVAGQDLRSSAAAVNADAMVHDLDGAQHHMFNAVTRGHAFAAAPERWIRNKPQFAPHEQLAVYINAYRWRLQDVVAEDYPVLKHLLGDDAFTALLEAFVAGEVSTHFNIGRFATKLPAFIKRHLPDHAFAHELCELETLIAQLADGAQLPALAFDALHNMTPEGFMSSRLFPQPALALCAFAYPVNAYYCAVQEQGSAAVPTPQPGYLVVFGHDERIWRMELQHAEYAMLSALFGGKTVGDALEHLQAQAADQGEHLTESIGQWFARWMRNGLLTGVAAEAPQNTLSAIKTTRGEHNVSV